MRLIRVAAVALASLIALPALAGDIPKTFRSDSSGQLPSGVKASGTVLRSVSWVDDKGDNLAVFSTTSKVKTKKGHDPQTTTTIFVDIFQGKNGKLKKQRSVREVVANCEFDVTNEFLPTSVMVSDLDQNGVGELTFVYRSDCRSDVSPATMKLLVLEGAKKYILRGHTRIFPGGKDQEPVGGDYTPDMKGAPQAFLDHADKVWKKFVTE